MADYDFPADLLDAQRAYYEADAAVEKAAAALPSSIAMVNGTLTDEEEEKLPGQRKALADARAKREKALAKLNGHDWWKQQEVARDRHAAWMALQKAARA